MVKVKKGAKDIINRRLKAGLIHTTLNKTLKAYLEQGINKTSYS